MKIKGNKWFRNLSGTFAMIGFLLCLLNFGITADHPQGCILWVAEAFAVSLLFGYLGLEFELWLNRKKFVAVGRKSILFGIAAAIVLGAGLGAVGQTLYALEFQEYTETEIIDGGKKSQSNVALMVDYSASMTDILPSYLKATDELIDKLDSDTSLQFAAFTSVDIDETTHATQMLPLTDANKKVIKDFHKNLNYIYGFGTNFDIAIDFAVNSLEKNKSGDTRSVIVILTDCEGTASQDVLNNCKQKNCELYVLTLNNGPSSVNQLEQVADKYFQLETNTDGTINVDDAVLALEEAVSGDITVEITKKKLVLTENMIGGLGELSVARVIITLLFFGLMGAAAGFVYYGFESVRLVLVNFALGAFSGILSFLYLPLGVVFLLAAGLGSFNKYTVTEGNSDV